MRRTSGSRPTTCRLCVLVALLALIGTLAAGPATRPADPIAARVDRAKTAYAAERKRADGAVNDFIDHQETLARRRGDRDAVREVLDERSAFRDGGTLPADLPDRLAGRYASARLPLEQAYERAVRDYTRARHDAKATAAARALAALRATSPTGGANLLPEVDPDKDAVCGHWSRAPDGSLRSDPAGNASLRLPFRPEGEYDLRVRLTRVAGRHGIYLLLTYGGHDFAWAVNNSDDGGGKSKAGFELLDGRSFLDNRSTVLLDDPTAVGHESVLIAKVRKTGVTIYLDGKPVSALKTDYANLSPFGEWKPGPGAIAIGTSNASVTVWSAEATAVGKAP